MDLKPGQKVSIVDADTRADYVPATVIHSGTNGLTGHHIVQCRYKDGRERYQYAYDIKGWTR